MARLLTLVADVVPADGVRAPGGYEVRPCQPADIEALGGLYFASYDPGQACADLTESIADIQAVYDGEYGELWPAASLVVTVDRQPVAAIQVVKRAPWADTPDCPFVIELFTGRAHRHRGLARLRAPAASRLR